MIGFVGKHQTTLDDKGRFALPAKFRNLQDANGVFILSGTLILTKGLEDCLTLYTGAEWGKIQQRLSGLSFTNRDFRYFCRRFYSSATTVIPDRNGRILVPAYLIEEAHLGRDLWVIGVNDWIDIWNPERYKQYIDGYGGSYEDVAERLFPGHDPGGQ